MCRAQDSVESVDDRRFLKAVTVAQNPYQFAEDKVIDMQAGLGAARLGQQRVDLSALRQVVFDEIANEDIRVDRDHRFLACARPIAAFISSTDSRRCPGRFRKPLSSRTSPPTPRTTTSPRSLTKKSTSSPVSTRR